MEQDKLNHNDKALTLIVDFDSCDLEGAFDGVQFNGDLSPQLMLKYDVNDQN